MVNADLPAVACDAYSSEEGCVLVYGGFTGLEDAQAFTEMLRKVLLKAVEKAARTAYDRLKKQGEHPPPRRLILKALRRYVSACLVWDFLSDEYTVELTIDPGTPPPATFEILKSVLSHLPADYRFWEPERGGYDAEWIIGVTGQLVFEEGEKLRLLFAVGSETHLIHGLEAIFSDDEIPDALERIIRASGDARPRKILTAKAPPFLSDRERNALRQVLVKHGIKHDVCRGKKLRLLKRTQRLLEEDLAS